MYCSYPININERMIGADSSQGDTSYHHQPDCSSSTNKNEVLNKYFPQFPSISESHLLINTTVLEEILMLNRVLID